MSLYVPGVGNVPVIWMPASDEDYKDESEGGRSGYRPIAIVHHRAVAELNSIDGTFARNDADPHTVGAQGRAVSAHFAIGHDTNGRLEIHQYVNLSDTAYCNGDCPSGTRWDTWYGHKGHNERTVSIEHDDNASSSDPTIKGLVDEVTIKTSIELDRLLLSGDRDAMRAAGIRIRDDGTAEALGKIVPGPQTLIDHRDIAGSNKPYCWRPWKADTIGFPRRRYIDALTAAPEAIDLPTLSSYLPGYVATVKAGMNIRTAPKLTASVIRVTSAKEPWVVVGLTKGDLDGDCGTDQWVARWAGGKWEYTSACNLVSAPSPAPDPTPFDQSDIDAATRPLQDKIAAAIDALS